MIVCMSVCFFHTSAKNIIFEYCLTLTSSFFFYPGSLTVFLYVCRYVPSFRCFTSFATLLFSIMAADHLIINLGYNCKNWQLDITSDRQFVFVFVWMKKCEKQFIYFLFLIYIWLFFVRIQFYIDVCYNNDYSF